MPVSSGLQKYFDSQYKKKSKGEMGQKFEDLAWQIDPAFMQSFEAFHDKLLDIVDENPQAEEMVVEEISNLDMKLKNSGRKHDMKKAAAIIRSSENA